MWVAGLGKGGDGAHFNATKAKVAERVDGVAFFIEASGKADAVGELQAHAFEGLKFRFLWAEQGEEPSFFSQFEAGHAEVVGGFRVEVKQATA